MSGRFYPTRFDVESPERMERTLRLVFDAIYRLGDADLGIKQTALAEVAKLGESLSAPKITSALSSVGPAPLNVEGLLGQLAQPQKAGAPSVSALPDALLSQDGELVFFDQQLYRFDATTEPGTWTAVTVRIVPLEDAVTNAVSTVLTLIHTSTGTVAAGFGAGLLYKLEDAAGATQSAGSLDIAWDDAGATQDARFAVRLMTAGAALAEVVRITAAATTYSGGHTLYGGSAANDDLTLEGTSHATKTTSYVILQPNSGNVGIGTTGPDYKLHVDALATASVVHLNSSNATPTWLNLTAGATVMGAISRTGNALAIQSWTGGADGYLLLNPTSHNVGIGTTAPDSLLHVNGGIALLGAGGGNRFVFAGTPTAAPRTITIPDVSDTLVTLGATQTLTAKTLTTPTIGDFTNAQHDHSAANKGGALNSVVAAHTIPLAKITAGGTDGSVTWTADGRVSAFVDPT